MMLENTEREAQCKIGIARSVRGCLSGFGGLRGCKMAV
jgi:hypothetical protein